MLNYNGDSRYPHLIPDLKRSASNIMHFFVDSWDRIYHVFFFYKLMRGSFSNLYIFIKLNSIKKLKLATFFGNILQNRSQHSLVICIGKSIRLVPVQAVKLVNGFISCRSFQFSGLQSPCKMRKNKIISKIYFNLLIV